MLEQQVCHLAKETLDIYEDISVRILHLLAQEDDELFREIKRVSLHMASLIAGANRSIAETSNIGDLRLLVPIIHALGDSFVLIGTADDIPSLARLKLVNPLQVRAWWDDHHVQAYLETVQKDRTNLN